MLYFSKPVLRTFLISAICGLASFHLMAQEQVDSITGNDLNEVTVEARIQTASAKVSTYIPTSRQKTASQTGIDLLGRMGIPQLSVMPGLSSTVKTASGQAVAMYIDGLPATSEDISAMRMTDVKRVEYYDYPDDPRFQNNPHVVNFVMQHYEYGGYIKVLSDNFLIANSYNLNIFAKLQYKRMTFDVGVGGYYMDSKYGYSNSTETFRLTQPDGTDKEIVRTSATDAFRTRRKYGWPTFKAMYSSEKVTMRNTLGTNFDHFPLKRSVGNVRYSGYEYADVDFSTSGCTRSNSVSYNGDWYFVFGEKDNLSMTPAYSYTHTSQQSDYIEDGAEFRNDAKDNTHNAGVVLEYAHQFSSAHSLSLEFLTLYVANRTHYYGNSSSYITTDTWRLNSGVGYSFSSNHIYANVAAGFTWDKSIQGDVKEISAAPYLYLSAQYSPSNRHQIALSGNYFISNPSGAQRSAVVIEQNPLMSYTGNPFLKSQRFYSFSASYTWLPSNIFNLTLYCNPYTIGKRMAYRYEQVQGGVLRTIVQPMGAYTQVDAGLNGTLRLFENKLMLMGNMFYKYTYDAAFLPHKKSAVHGIISAAYYAGSWNFSGYYATRSNTPEGCLNGVWCESEDAYGVQAGWGNADWSVSAYLCNFLTWNYKSSESKMSTDVYSSYIRNYAIDRHAFIKLSATYTFGFGKKISRQDEASQQTGTASGILH